MSSNSSERRSSSTARGQGTTGNGGGTDPCDLFIDIDLEGVRAVVLAGLSVGDSLKIELRHGDGFRSAVCTTKEGQIVGALAAYTGLSALINCLQRNQKYQVAITSLTASSCHVIGGKVAE